MKLLFSYIRLHYKSVVMFVCFSVVFITVFYLYSLPMEPVIYATVLCIVTGIIIFSVSFSKFRQKHNDFMRMRESIIYGLSDFPEPRNILESDYAQLINILFEEKCRAESEKSSAISDMTDYYTLWVHQIKTPIAAMNLLLQNGEADIGELSDQLFKIEQYVGMVLTYLRCDFNTTDYVIKSNELDGIIRGAVRKYAKSFIREKISLDFRETSCNILTDEKWFSVVLEQLISNALKYTRQGKISIYAENNHTLVIEDTGIGIAPEDLPRVCEKGFTGYNGRADKKSTGIGLFLCKKILDRLSHEMSITSTVGVGTRVCIDFKTVTTRYE